MLEEQLLSNASYLVSVGGYPQQGQRLTISNRFVTHLAFRLKKVGNPTWTHSFHIISVATGALLASTAANDDSGLSGAAAGAWVNLPLTTPTLITEEVRIYVSHSAGVGEVTCIRAFYQNSDVKSGEYVTVYSGGAWVDSPTIDFAYYYTFISDTDEGVVTTQAVTAIAQTTATGNGNITSLGDPTATQHGHCWAVFPKNPTVSDNLTSNGVPAAAGAYTSSLTGLLPNTTYTIRSYIRGAWGTTYGGLLVFTTLGNSPSVSVQATTAITATTATGNGNVLALGIPAATQYGHCWDVRAEPTKDDSESGFWGKTSLGVPGATGPYTSTLTGLKQNTYYYVRAYITSSLGTYYSPQQAYFITLGGVPLVTTKEATEVTETTALGNGSVDNTGGSLVTQHGVCWREDSDGVDPTIALVTRNEEGTALVGDFISLMEGLTANILYRYRAYATNSEGTGYGAVKTFSTNITSAPTVTTESPTNVQAPLATGHGTIVSIGGSAVTEHGVVWSTSVKPTIASHVGGGITTDGPVAAGPFNSNITGLVRGTTYHYRAYATNTQGDGYGNDVSFTAGYTYPDPIASTLSRVTNLVHRYDKSAGVYQLEMSLGDISSVLALTYEIGAKRATAVKDLEQDTKRIIQVAKEEKLLEYVLKGEMREPEPTPKVLVGKELRAAMAEELMKLVEERYKQMDIKFLGAKQPPVWRPDEKTK